MLTRALGPNTGPQVVTGTVYRCTVNSTVVLCTVYSTGERLSDGRLIMWRINWADTDTGVTHRYIIITFPGNIRDALLGNY